MSGPRWNNFQERVEQSAEAALKRNGSVGPLELFQEMGLLHHEHVEGWRKGNEHYQVLQNWIQAGPEKFQKAIGHFQAWVKTRGLRGSGRVGRSAAGRTLEASAVDLSVIAHLRHAHTNYEELLMRGIDRRAARALVREKIEDLLTSWSGKCTIAMNGLT